MSGSRLKHHETWPESEMSWLGRGITFLLWRRRPSLSPSTHAASPTRGPRPRSRRVEEDQTPCGRSAQPAAHPLRPCKLQSPPCASPFPHANPNFRPQWQNPKRMFPRERMRRNPTSRARARNHARRRCATALSPFTCTHRAGKGTLSRRHLYALDTCRIPTGVYRRRHMRAWPKSLSALRAHPRVTVLSRFREVI